MAAVFRQALLRNQLIEVGSLDQGLSVPSYLMSDNLRRRLHDEAQREESGACSVDSSAQSDRYELTKQRKLQKVSALKEKLKFTDALTGALSLGGVLLSFIELEDNYLETEHKSRYESSDFGVFLQVLVSVSTLALLVLVQRHHYLEFLVARERGVLDEGVGDSYRKSVHFKNMLLENALCAVHPLPGLDIKFEFGQLNGTLVINLSSILTSIMLLRSYILLRVVIRYSKWANLKSERTCHHFGCENSNLFVLRCFLQDRPYSSLCMLMGTTIVVLGFATRLYERPYNLFNGEDQDYDYIWNSM